MMQIQIDLKPIVRFAIVFAASAAVVLAILVLAPAGVGLSVGELAGHTVLILVCYLFGVLAISLWRGWVRIGS
jgi:hypothetical protein